MLYVPRTRNASALLSARAGGALVLPPQLPLEEDAAPLPPRATDAAPPPAYQTFRLEFSGIRAANDPLAFGVQISEARLYAGRRQLKIASARAINGDGPEGHGAANAIDGDLNTKWVDAGVRGPRGRSVLELTLALPEVVTSYELVAANDWPQRDPTAWTLSARDTLGSARPAVDGFVQLDAQLPFPGRPPGRLASYSRLHLGEPQPDVATACTDVAAAGAPLLLIDASGGCSPVWSDMASLDELEGELWAFNASAGLAALVLYEQPAFVGRALTIRVTRAGVVARLPAAARHGARSAAAPPLRRWRARACIHDATRSACSRRLPTRARATAMSPSCSPRASSPTRPPTRCAWAARCAVCSRTRGRASAAARRSCGGRRWARCAASRASLPFAARSLRVVGEAHAVAADANGTAAVLRRSAPRLAPGSVASICCGRRLRAVELYAGIGWTGRTSLVAPSNKCMQYAAAAALDGAARSARLRRVDDSLELLGPATTITPLVGAAAGGANASGGAAKMRWKVVGVATPSLDALRFAVERVRAGAAVAAVALYRKPRYAGERLDTARRRVEERGGGVVGGAAGGLAGQGALGRAAPALRRLRPRVRHGRRRAAGR